MEESQEAGKWLKKKLVQIANWGGKKVPEQEYKRRLLTCKSCEYAGKVEPIPNVELPGCERCGCPFETKLKFEYHFLSGFKLIKCPHPEGPKW